MVAPYQTKPGYLYIPCKRGDGIIAPNKTKQVRLFDGMCGGYIDPEDWQTPPVLSPYTQGETLWIEIRKTKAMKQWAANAGKPQGTIAEKYISTDYRRMSSWIDFKALEPYVRLQVPDFLKKVWQHKLQIPVVKLDTIDPMCIKDAQAIDTNRTLIDDVGQITQGTYTIGPAAGDNYPTFGGAGGGWAALGNLTGNLTFQLTGNITETGIAAMTENLGGFTLTNTSNAPHYGDPTRGWLVQVNHQTVFMQPQCEGPGTFIAEHLHSRRVAAPANNTIEYDPVLIDAAFNLYLRNLLVNCNARSEFGFYLRDNTPIIYAYNNVIWDAAVFAGICYNILASAINQNSIIENTACYGSENFGIDLNGQVCTVRNCTAYGNGVDFNGTANSTGRYNRSSDLTAANANWAAGVGNTTGAVVAADVQGINDAAANFFDIIVGGPLDSAGEANAIAARTTCIRNRAVPNYLGGTSIGPAEIPPVVSGRNIAVLHGSHIAIPRMGIGIY